MAVNRQIKSRSITSKASSACKINMGLVYGEMDVQNSKSFRDRGGLMAKKMRNQPIDEIVNSSEELDEDLDEEGKKIVDGGQSSQAIDPNN
jgi:hypothetical protein|tara:strand:+ start:2995 stop:3267 length:273 start_codon:yes stop_codon:yes gene_type:complete